MRQFVGIRVDICGSPVPLCFSLTARGMLRNSARYHRFYEIDPSIDLPL